MVRVPVCLVMFLVVRGVPTLWTHRRDLERSDRRCRPPALSLSPWCEPRKAVWRREWDSSARCY
jgi:hypothetical protein